MKLSEKLSIIKRAEGDLNRAIKLRGSIIRKDFSDTISSKDNFTTEEIEAREKTFIGNKIKRIQESNKVIDEMKVKLLEEKNAVNQKNIEIGIDKKLLEIKHVRIELAELMKISTRDSFLSRRTVDFDVDIYETLGISDRIRELEERKDKLDSEIQNINWHTEI